MESRDAPTSHSVRVFLIGAITALLALAIVAACYFIFRVPTWAYAIVLTCGFAFNQILLWKWGALSCPNCGRRLTRRDRVGFKSGENIRYVCPNCQIEWKTRLSVPNE